MRRPPNYKAASANRSWSFQRKASTLKKDTAKRKGEELKAPWCEMEPSTVPSTATEEGDEDVHGPGVAYC